MSDTGPGIGEEERDLVTRRFYRSDKSRHTDGLGLGLNLVAAIARFLRGGNSGRYTRAQFWGACIALASSSLEAMVRGDEDAAEQLLSDARAAHERARESNPQRKGGRTASRRRAPEHAEWIRLAKQSKLTGRARAAAIARQTSAKFNTVKSFLYHRGLLGDKVDA